MFDEEEDGGGYYADADDLVALGFGGAGVDRVDGMWGRACRATLRGLLTRQR